MTFVFLSIGLQFSALLCLYRFLQTFEISGFPMPPPPCGSVERPLFFV